ncbi:Signal transduction histidine kinase [Jatrophihabitans endophyticus]|uniref:histidine kinase n=1 Tax=Jatrophihabitans endophyticus TaxID=1206085 RepID=A0A1M5E9V6_9ACTN|nr:HAMP domain-containing sensor histidine kinase [Jatrophihabitans endophyticus]SHF76008.1 Signal transduction histidine kinase [Jatrophihabitans endophyticus]
MTSTLRRRALAAIALGFPVGWLLLDIGWRLAAALLVDLRGSDGADVACGGSGLSRAVGVFNGCNSLQYRYGFAAVELVLGLAIVAVITYALARWVTEPLRRMTDAVEQLGPTNLGLRLRQRGPAGDETRRLADAVDAMLDRVAEGYEAQRRFAANASHELRTPLATQRALIEVSLSSALTADQLELLSRQLLATNERNEALIDGLLTLAETERGVLSTESIALDRVVAEVVETLRPTAVARGVELCLAADPVTVVGERPLLERLVTNLVQNGVKYNDAGGSVHVTVRVPGNLVVANTGPAVPPEQVAGLFEPFRRLAGERLDHGGGVGLGLTIARSVVAAHGGTIAARANPDGGLTVETGLRPPD